MPWFWQELELPRNTKKTSNIGSANGKDIHEDTSTKAWLSPANILQPSTLLSTALLTTCVFAGLHVYKTYLRRIPNVSHLKPAYYRSRSVFGRVTAVGDADNFRLYHTPGGRFLGWHWAREVPSVRKDLVDQTLHIRIAGVDAPELPHFGQPGQKYGAEAMDWLKSTLDDKDVRVYPYSRDQYGRVVASVKVRRWWDLPGLGTKDLGLEMIKSGWAEVYKSKGAEYGGREDQYLEAEKQAKSQHHGMWHGSNAHSLWGKFFTVSKEEKEVKLESPRDYKRRMAKDEPHHKDSVPEKKKK